MDTKTRIEENVPHAIASALKTGVGYAAGSSTAVIGGEDAYAILVVVGSTAERLRDLLDATNGIARHVRA